MSQTCLCIDAAPAGLTFSGLKHDGVKEALVESKASRTVEEYYSAREALGYQKCPGKPTVFVLLGCLSRQ